MYFPGHKLNARDRLLMRQSSAEQKRMVASRVKDNPETYRYTIVLEVA
jgi:hypothetical protein